MRSNSVFLKRDLRMFFFSPDLPWIFYRKKNPSLFSSLPFFSHQIQELCVAAQLEQQHGSLRGAREAARRLPGSPDQLQWNGHHQVHRSHGLCPGDLAGAGAPQCQGQERRLRGGKALLHLQAEPRCPGATQQGHLPWHQRGKAGGWHLLSHTVGSEYFKAQNNPA